MTLARAFTPNRDFAPGEAEAPPVEEIPDVPMIEEAEAAAAVPNATASEKVALRASAKTIAPTKLSPAPTAETTPAASPPGM